MVEDDLRCDICIGKDWTDDDAILICERCFASTHQKCLQQDIKDKVPDGDWFCQRCQYLLDNEDVEATSIECQICF